MYDGQSVTIPLGTGGLYTDDPDTITPSSKLSRAVNISLLRGKIEKDFGSRKWNNEALPDKVLHIVDWWPNTVTQRFVAVCGDGKTYRFRHSHYSELITPDTTAPGVLSTTGYITSTEGGAESAGSDKKLFIFTGNNEIQVVTGDETTRTNIEKPAADWSGNNQPFKGIIHRGYLFAFGNENAPSRIYRSSSTDHEDFTTLPWTDNIFPGEGEMLMDAISFKGKLMVFKFPVGIYILNDADATPGNWYFQKFNESVGTVSPFAIWEVLNDLLIANEHGTVTSLSAIDAYGDVESADLFNNLRVDDAIDQEMNLTGGNQRRAIYYGAKKMAYVTYQSLAGIANDRIVQVKFGSRTPEITISDKDQPNCLALRKDIFGVKRPFYGANDGFIYQMDTVDRDVAGNAYRGEFQTPNMDFGNLDPRLAETSKNFDFLEVIYEPTGYAEITIEYYIDGRYIDTRQIDLRGFSTLGVIKTDEDRMSALCPMSKRIPIMGQGRRISVRIYNDGLLENFKITGLKIYFKIQGEQQTVRE